MTDLPMKFDCVHAHNIANVATISARKIITPLSKYWLGVSQGS